MGKIYNIGIAWWRLDKSIVAAFNKPQILGIGIEFDLMMEEVEESLAWSRMPSTSLPRSLTSRFIRLASMRSESQFYNAWIKSNPNGSTDIPYHKDLEVVQFPQLCWLKRHDTFTEIILELFLDKKGNSHNDDACTVDILFLRHTFYSVHQLIAN